ncbi:hypothetical protein QQP08_007615 [Theobroma cacao]|nr:hypothetical protein QQP08_007615 [Theobroma cacao]
MKEINWFQFYQEITQSKARVIEILVHWRPGSLQINQTWMNGCSRSNTKNVSVGGNCPIDAANLWVNFKTEFDSISTNPVNRALQSTALAIPGNH